MKDPELGISAWIFILTIFAAQMAVAGGGALFGLQILGIGLALFFVSSWLGDLAKSEDGPNRVASKETGEKRKRQRKKPRYHQSAPERPGYMSLDEAIAWEKEHAKR